MKAKWIPVTKEHIRKGSENVMSLTRCVIGLALTDALPKAQKIVVGGVDVDINDDTYVFKGNFFRHYKRILNRKPVKPFRFLLPGGSNRIIRSIKPLDTPKARTRKG